MGEAKGSQLVTIRNFRLKDLVACVQLVNEIDKVDSSGRATCMERVTVRLGQPGYYPEADLFFAERDGLLLGYADIVRELEIGRVILSGAIHPGHRGQGLGRWLLETAVEHSRKLGARVVQIPVASGVPAGEQFLRRNGFRVVRRHWRMSIDKYRHRICPVPGGFELHRFVPGDEESLCALQNRAFAGSWGFRPNTVAEIRYQVNIGGGHPEGILFLSDGERQVGYCWTMAHPAESGKGQIKMIGVVPEYRGRGLGRALLVAGVSYLRGRGMKEIELTVDGNNIGAIRLYRSAGFKRTGIILWYQRRLQRAEYKS